MKNTHNTRGVSFAGRRHRQPGTNPLVGIHAAIDHGYRLVGAVHNWNMHDAAWPGGTHQAPAPSNRD
jgi:hypothetical protein